MVSMKTDLNTLAVIFVIILGVLVIRGDIDLSLQATLAEENFCTPLNESECLESDLCIRVVDDNVTQNFIVCGLTIEGLCTESGGILEDELCDCPDNSRGFSLEDGCLFNVCAEVLEPICGTNNETYNNICEAGPVEKACDGECPCKDLACVIDADCGTVDIEDCVTGDITSEQIECIDNTCTPPEVILCPEICTTNLECTNQGFDGCTDRECISCDVDDFFNEFTGKCEPISLEVKTCKIFEKLNEATNVCEPRFDLSVGVVFLIILAIAGFFIFRKEFKR